MKTILFYLGFNQMISSRLSRFDSLSIVSRQSVFAIIVACLILFSGNAWADGAITVSSAITLPKGSTSVSTGDWISAAGVTKAGSSWAYSDWSGDQTIGSYGTITFNAAGDLNISGNYLQFQASNGYIQTTISSAAGVDIVIGYKVGGNYFTVSLDGASNVTGSSTSWSTMSISTTSTSATLKIHKNTKNAGYVSYITITPKAAASCTTNATVSAGSNSSVTTTTATISCTGGITSLGSAGCSISSYGFALNTTGTPTISDTKHQIGTSYTTTGTGFSKNLTELSAGTTYYVRPYATNGKGTAYGTQTSFTTLFEASITLDKNNSDASGSSSGSAKAVENATSLSNISAPTRTGYTLEGYYTTSGCATKIATSAGAFQASITVSSNTWTNGSSQWKRNASETFYANWTANTYSVVFNKNNNDATGTMSNESFTYGESKALTACAFSLDGYDFAGWATTSGGSVAYTDGQSVSNLTATNSGTFNLYAKWTIKSYSVTWIVNNGNYSAGGSSSVNHGSHISTLPTAPDPNDYCGDKFMGWTDAEDGAYVHGTSNLYKTASEFPNATGTQIFYAVFADYDD